MADVEADIWVLTETWASLAPAPGFRRVAVSADAPDRGEGECWTAVWVRGCIRGVQIPTCDPERTACARLSFRDRPPLYIYGTVLPWLSDRRREPVRGARAFQSALGEQAADWRRLRRDDSAAALYVAGDLNQDLLPRGHFYGSATGRDALLHALEEAGLCCLTGGAADPVARLGHGCASVDHICVAGCPRSAGATSNVIVWPSPEMLGGRLSDHHGVAADIVL